MKIFLKSIKDGMFFFMELISNFVNIILLFFVYFSVLALTAIFAKIFKKKFLSLEIYNWIKVSQGKEKSNYFRQF